MVPVSRTHRGGGGGEVAPWVSKEEVFMEMEITSRELPCPSFPSFFCFAKEALKINQAFFSLGKRTKTLEKNQRKCTNNQGNSLLTSSQGIQKKPRKGRTGLGAFCRGGSRDHMPVGVPLSCSPFSHYPNGRLGDLLGGASEHFGD